MVDEGQPLRGKRAAGEPGSRKSVSRAFLEEAKRTPGMSLGDRLHGYLYGRWPYFYVSVATGEHRFSKLLLPLLLLGLKLIHRKGGGAAEGAAEGAARIRAAESKGGAAESKPDTRFPQVPPGIGRLVADGYHGKVVRTQEARQLVTLNKPIEIRDLDQVIPFPRARDIVMRNPDHIVALDCPCRASRTNPCTPIDVCLVIGEPFASFVIEGNPGRARWITQQQAVEILEQERDRGHVHHAFFKDAMLGRFYAICNCCSCCCGAMQAWEHGTPMLASSGYVAQIDPERCTACESCIETCQFGAISMTDGESAAEGWAVVNQELCMGCGVCAFQCEFEASTLVRDPSKGEPLAIRELVAQDSAHRRGQPDRAEQRERPAQPEQPGLF